MTKYSTFEDISFILKRKPGQKSVRMHINPRGQLEVSCNTLKSDSEIRDFISSNKDWIKKHSVLLKPYSYETGELIPFWGNDYTLKVMEGKKAVHQENNLIIVSQKDIHDKEKIRKALFEFYKKQLEHFISNRIPFWSSLLEVDVPVFSVNNSKSRWGVCYCRRKEIKISAMTACLDEKLIDMTVLHELCHLKHPNHSEAFWTEMGKFMPDLKNRELMLKHVDRTHAIHSLF